MIALCCIIKEYTQLYMIPAHQNPGLRVQGERQLCCGRNEAQPVPGLSLQEMFAGQHEERR